MEKECVRLEDWSDVRKVVCKNQEEKDDWKNGEII